MVDLASCGQPVCLAIEILSTGSSKNVRRVLPPHFDTQYSSNSSDSAYELVVGLNLIYTVYELVVGLNFIQMIMHSLLVVGLNLIYELVVGLNLIPESHPGTVSNHLFQCPHKTYFKSYIIIASTHSK